MNIKKLSSLLIAIFLLSMSSTALAIESTSPVDREVVVYVNDNTTYRDCDEASIVVVPEGKLAIVKEYAKSLVDDGKILYIQDTAKNKEELAVYFSIPKETRSAYNNLEHIAATIYKINDLYVFSYIYVYIDIDGTARQESPMLTKDIIDINDAFVSARNLYNDAHNDPTQQNMAARGLPSITADQISSDVVQVYSGSTYRGDGMATQYVYKKGYGTVNGKTQYIYDAVTSFKAAPVSSTYVLKYEGGMHCNITNHTLVDYVILPSNTSASTGLSLSATGVGTTTSWTYTPDSQIITSTGYPSSRFVSYVCVPQVTRYGQTWEAVPGMRVATTQPAGSRGVFSKITIPVVGFWGNTVDSFSVEVGEWF